ncbi:MAG: tetratricopeptide repeat-containing sensor histidine kinase [Chitinophagales bacterium]
MSFKFPISTFAPSPIEETSRMMLSKPFLFFSKKNILWLCLILWVNLLHAEKDNNPKTEIATLLELTNSIKIKDINQAIIKAEEALVLAEGHQYSKEKIQTYILLGELYSTLQKPSKSETYYQKALKESRQQKNLKGELSAMIGWAGVLEMKGDYQASLEELLKANSLAHKLIDTQELSKINMNIAHIYCNYGEFDQAIVFLKKAKKIYEESKNSNNLSKLYNNMAIVYKANGQLDSAKLAFLEAVKLGEVLKDEIGILQTYNNIGMMYLLENKLDTAEYYMLSASVLANKLDVENPLTYFNLGRLYLEKQYLLKAEKNTKRALNAYENENMKIETMKTKMLLANIYAAQGNYKLAFLHQKELESIKDDIFDTDISSEVELMENKYELQQNELKLMALDKENQKRKYMLIGLVGLMLFSVVFVWMFIRQKNLRNKEERLLLEQRLLRSQMNPHFIFNALSVIQGFIFKNNPKDAGRYLAKFSMLIRMILENSRKEYVPLDEEIASLEYYLDLQQLRFQDKFDYKIELDKEVFPEQIAIAPMLTQPFIENAIEHGIQNKDGKGFLDMYFELKKDLLYFTLEDDGVGRTRSSELQEKRQKHQSLSTQITKERLTIYHRKKKVPFMLNINDRLNSIGEIIGTRVSIQIPYKHL